MVRLASIEFTRLKGVRRGTHLTFPTAGAVLLGQNGTGKTTLLQYIVALCTANPSVFVGDEPFDVSARFHFSAGVRADLRFHGQPGRIGRPIPEAPDAARYFPPEESVTLEYTILMPDGNTTYRIIAIDGRAELYCNSQPLCTPFPVGLHPNQLDICIWRLREIARLENLAEREKLLSLAIEISELQDNLCRYDEGLDYFRMLTDEHSTYTHFGIVAFGPRSTESIPQHNTHLTRRIPHSLSHTLSQTLPVLKTDSDLEQISTKHSGVTFLSAFVGLSKFKNATIIMPFDARRTIEYGVIYEFRPLRFNFELGSERISHSKLSFGQRRLLSYLYYLECNTEIGVADELVNGMHHEWIEHCLITACGNRQMFYTSQNPLLLDFLEFGSEVEVSERFVTCDWNEQDGFVWQNLPPRIGQEFYRLYKTGIQHVSDILRTKGWW
jgi:energy-coupling factor transporter ATP-binding protein EcfA2